MSVFTDYEDWIDEETDEMIEQYADYAVKELKWGGEISDYYVESGLIDRFVAQQMMWLSFEEMEQILDESTVDFDVISVETEEAMQRAQVEQTLHHDIKQQLTIKTRPFVASRLEQLCEEQRDVASRAEVSRLAYEQVVQTLKAGPAPEIIAKRWYRRERIIHRSFTPDEQARLEQRRQELEPEYQTDQRRLEELQRERTNCERLLR